MAEKNPPLNKPQSDYISDSDTSEEKIDKQLCMSTEERHYGTIRGSVQATQAALSYTRAQCNPTIERD